jgi:lambda family phage portal protein
MPAAIVPSRISDNQLATLRQQGIPAIIVSNASFEGASRTRRMGNWGASNAGPNSAMSGNLGTLRNRSHEFLRNHPLAQSAIDTYVSNLVGTGIVPRWRVNDIVGKEVRDYLQRRFLRWTDESDSEGLTDFYGQQALAVRTTMEGGEGLTRRRPRRRQDGLTVPLQIQLMEADHLPHTLNQPAPNGNEIQMGVEFNKVGRRAAYWLYRRHPGDQFYNAGDGGTPVRVPAEDIIHTFRALRPGQIRGLPWLTTVMVRLYELDQYTDAELVRKKTAALFAGFVTSPTSSSGNQIDPMTGQPIKNDGSRDYVGLEPGTLQYLDPGEEVVFSTPADVGANTLSWLQQQLREIAVGIGVTYEQLTGDLSNVNYSSLRAGLVEFRRRCEMLQFSMMVFQFCRPVLAWWMDTGVMTGTLALPDYWSNRSDYLDVDWRAPGWEYVNPLEDRLAEQMDIRNGLDSRAGVVAKRGRDVEEVDRQISEDNARVDELSIILDSDPRYTAKSGVMQQAEAGAVANATGNGGTSK